MIPDNWKRIAGLKTAGGSTAAVWVASDPDSQVVYVYDCALWDAETFEHIAKGISNRGGRKIPIAWSNKEFADKLLYDYGLNMLPDAVSENESVAEAESRSVWELMRTKQFRVMDGLAEWKREYLSYNRESGKVPLDEYPLMTATWYAISQLQYARAPQTYRSNQKTYPDVAMLTCRK